jgi:hypothetical protein
MTAETKTPTEQLVDLLVYAPVGLAYDYQKVLDQLVVKGKSQVQLARLLAKMAAKKGQTEFEESVTDALGLVARGITELGVAVGLAPSPEELVDVPGAHESTSAVEDPPVATAPVPKKSSVKKASAKARKPSAEDAPAQSARPPAGSVVEPISLPIAGYDTLTAREITALLGDLDDGQRARVREHESTNRGRKTVLAQLDRLDRA